MLNQFSNLGLFLLALLCTSCMAFEDSPSIPYETGISTHYLTVNGTTRKYLVYRPEDLKSVSAVVIVLHGGGGLGLEVAELGTHPLSVFRTVADSESILVVYPEGSPDIQGNEGWNDCRSDHFSGSKGDDIIFLKQLNEKLQSELRVTSDSIFMTGTSNGALMTYMYTFHYPETLKAIAISSGNLPLYPKVGLCSDGSKLPIPILITYGTNDPMMPANGGCVATLGGACNRGRVVSQTETINYWLQRNFLQNVNPVVSTFDLNPNDAGNVEKRVYSSSHPMILFILNNAGHQVPSKQVLVSSSTASGVQNRDIEYAEEVWSFFKRLQ